MFRAEKEAGMYLKRIPARGELFNVPETIPLYYNDSVIKLCRSQNAGRQREGSCCLLFLLSFGFLEDIKCRRNC